MEREPEDIEVETMIQIKEFRDIFSLQEYMDQSKGLYMQVIPVSKIFSDHNGKIVCCINYVLVERV